MERDTSYRRMCAEARAAWDLLDGPLTALRDETDTERRLAAVAEAQALCTRLQAWLASVANLVRMGAGDQE